MLAAACAGLLLAGAPAPATAAGACSVVDGACICADSAGNEWDVTGLGLEDGRATAVATGECSGTDSDCRHCHRRSCTTLS